MYGCDVVQLNDSTFVHSALRTAAEQAGATWLDSVFKEFDPQGVTVVGLLAESHLSFHSWPEERYAAVDVFTCGDHCVPRRACEAMVQIFAPERHRLRELARGAEVRGPADVPDQNLASADGQIPSDR
jgi:S-adenosylmethionine decarboxylase